MARGMHTRNPQFPDFNPHESIIMPHSLIQTKETFDPIVFLQQLVQLDTCDPPGDERAIAQLIHQQLLALGVEF